MLDLRHHTEPQAVMRVFFPPVSTPLLCRVIMKRAMLDLGQVQTTSPPTSIGLEQQQLIHNDINGSMMMHIFTVFATLSI